MNPNEALNQIAGADAFESCDLSEAHRLVDVRESANLVTIARIVYGRDGAVREFTGRPKCRLFGFMAFIWLPLAICASFVLSSDTDFIESRWVWWLLVSFEPIFISLAVFCRFAEQPRRVIERHLP